MFRNPNPATLIAACLINQKNTYSQIDHKCLISLKPMRRLELRTY